MKKLPYGISDYERLMENDYYYVDKTMYIEKLENIAEPYIMFLRPNILLIPKDKSKGYKGVMIEFKYLKKDEAGKLEEKQIKQTEA